MDRGIGGYVAIDDYTRRDPGSVYAMVLAEVIPAQQRLDNEWYRGTADALYQNLDIIVRHDPDNVLILGGDHIYTMDYSKMLYEHVASGADLTVGCIEVPIEEASDLGVMSIDENYKIVDHQYSDHPSQQPFEWNH